MAATSNTFHGQSNPIVTSSDYDLITGGDLASEFGVPFVEDYPDGWTDNLQDASSYDNQDTISVSYEPCIDPISPEDSYVAIAIPLNLDGSVIVPVGGPLHDGSGLQGLPKRRKARSASLRLGGESGPFPAGGPG
jgi:hypothetical protein